MYKLLKSLFAIGALIIILNDVYAAASDDLIVYLEQQHVIAGQTVTMTDGQKTQLERYLNSNPVTDAQVATVKTKVQQIISIMDSKNTINPTKLTTAEKTTVINLIKDAGLAVGVTVTADSTNNSIALFDNTGAKLDVITFDSGRLPFTGLDVILYNIVAVIVIIIAMVQIIKKKLNDDNK